jgi:hypothetical protein
LARIAVVDTHSDESDDEPPTRVGTDQSLVAAFEPTTVTLATPVEGPFVATCELTETPEAATADVSVPTRDSAVTATTPTPYTPPLALLTTDESAIHAVTSLALPPMQWPALQRVVKPASLPTTVTVVAPVDATFVVTAELASGEACVNIDDMLATSECTVDVDNLLTPTPLDTFTITELSDRHSVDIDADMPIRVAELRVR